MGVQARTVHPSPSSTRVPTAEETARLNVQASMCKAMAAMAPEDAIGVACSVLLLYAERQPDMVRRVMSEPVVKEGFRGTPLWTVLRRVVCR